MPRLLATLGPMVRRISLALLVLVAIVSTAVAYSNHRRLAQQRPMVDIDMRREAAGVRL